MMNWQEIYDFIVDVYEAEIYCTNQLGGFTVTKLDIGWLVV